MPRSQSNDRTFPLAAGATFTGLPESTAEHVAISVNVLVPTNCTLTIQQSYNKGTWLITEEYPILANIHKTVQQAVGLEYFRVILTNNGITQTFCHLITTLSTSLTQNVNIRTLEASRDSITADISGSIVVSSQPHLSYLTDNVAVATMPAITGTVAVSSQPHLSYLTDNVAVATMPSITGTVAVSSQPHLSYLTDNVAVATMPSITGTVSVSSIATGNNLIGKVLTFENPSSTISLTNISTVGQTIKDSAGSLFNITVFNDGNSISYVKLYNVAVPTAGDTPVITLPVLHDSPINTISIHNYQFTTAIGVRATANYVANDTTAPNGATSITAFFNGVLP